MSRQVRSVEYYYVTVQDRPGQAAELLKLLADGGVDLLAFSIVPTGPTHTQLMLFPAEPSQLSAMAQRAQLGMVGPQQAFLVQGDNELGALVDIHQKLADANVNVYASSGVVDSRSHFGYVLYVRPEDFKRASVALGLAAPPTWRPGPPLRP